MGYLLFPDNVLENLKTKQKTFSISFQNRNKFKYDFWHINYTSQEMSHHFFYWEVFYQQNNRKQLSVSPVVPTVTHLQNRCWLNFWTVDRRWEEFNCFNKLVWLTPFPPPTHHYLKGLSFLYVCYTIQIFQPKPLSADQCNSPNHNLSIAVISASDQAIQTRFFLCSIPLSISSLSLMIRGLATDHSSDADVTDHFWSAVSFQKRK